MRPSLSWGFSLAFALALVCPATADTIDVCADVETIINHPAEFVEKKIKAPGISCLVNAICCSAIWESIPGCYEIQKILTRAPWNETVRRVDCSPKAVEDGVRELVNRLVSPTSLIVSPALLSAYNTVVDANTLAAQPLPDDVKAKLTRLVGFAGIPFDNGDVDRARWTKASNPTAAPLFPSLLKKDNPAITHGDLIIVSDEFLSIQGCPYFARWAHEVTHVYQNRRDGRAKFLDQYLREATEKGYDNISYEIDAVAVEQLVKSPQVCARL